MADTGKGKVFSCSVPSHIFILLAVTGMMQNVEFTG
jgi:hypothetical protein